MTPRSFAHLSLAEIAAREIGVTPYQPVHVPAFVDELIANPLVEEIAPERQMEAIFTEFCRRKWRCQTRAVRPDGRAVKATQPWSSPEERRRFVAAMGCAYRPYWRSSRT